jgi:hypothetical protein
MMKVAKFAVLSFGLLAGTALGAYAQQQGSIAALPPDPAAPTASYGGYYGTYPGYAPQAQPVPAQPPAQSSGVTWQRVGPAPKSTEEYVGPKPN